MKIGFIGGGRIAQALAKGFITAGITKCEKIIASCSPDDKFSAEEFKSIGARIDFDNKKIIEESEVIFLAVKPDVVPKVINEIKGTLVQNKLLISVAMGISIKQLEKGLGAGVPVVRAMPNTAASIGKAASAYSPGTSASPDQLKIVGKLFDAIGISSIVPEYLMDPVTALSGSGPAYIYVLIESLADGAVRMGLPRELAYRLASQTVVGAGEMVLRTGLHPAALKDNVTSPAGSTAEGLLCLEQGGYRATLIKAVEEATKKCEEVTKKMSHCYN